MCPTCERRRIAKNDTVCRTCRRFIAEFIETGRIPRRPVPLMGDVGLTMGWLGVSQDRAVTILGGQP